MSRPIPMYFISAWLAIWLIGVPVRNRAVLEMLIGPHATLLVMAIAIVAALIINFKFLQCERTYVDLALGIVSLQLGYLLTRYLWLVLIDKTPPAYPLQYLLILGLNLYCVIYLMQPSTLEKIAMARTAILARQQHKRQTKQAEDG